jgi:hypothetical protein
MPPCLLRSENVYNLCIYPGPHIQKDLTIPLKRIFYIFNDVIFQLSLVSEVERETRVLAKVEEILELKTAWQSLLPNLHIELTLTHAHLFLETRPVIAPRDLKLTE